MHTLADTALLPAGLMDVLPPFAAFEARMVERLMAHFASFGYERVKPPLIEFEETMLAGQAAALAPATFRLMDPVAQRMLALRPDMTMQVARIASSRLAHWPRPLRLAYAGQVLRVRGAQVRPERQFGQVGAEIVGSDGPAADVEVMVMATSALAELGVAGLTVDLGLPRLVPEILAAITCDPDSEARARLALDRKDAAAIAELAPVLGEVTADLLAVLVASTGPAEAALATLATLELPAAAAAERASLVAVYERLHRSAPMLTITIDAVENRGFEYHRGVTCTVFATSSTDEIGRGGRYRTEKGEAATGITLFMDAVLRALPRPEPQRRVLLPADAPAEVAQGLRREGWVALAALDDGIEPAHEARRLGCTHVFLDGRTVPAGRERRPRSEG
ncbi:MAG: ATP phosphoribosyltransferase regulatory subunit [Rhodospirillales bacterium]|nr:ATP phosphoribosyltransferase regulatory subunit [Rhodospirillales bacterium]